MKPGDWFGMIVRTIGLLCMLHGLWSLLGAAVSVVENVLYFFNLLAEPPEYSAMSSAVDGAAALTAGLILFFKASFIVSLTYEDHPPTKPDGLP